ncbi:MAG: hypothetical protein AAF125_21360 [Chloroflexota bacterium]
MNGWRLIFVLIFIALWGTSTVAPQDADYRIIFASDRDTNANWQLYTMDANGANVTRLTESTTYDYGAAVSPDGTQIAYTERTENGFTQIYLRNANGSGGKALLTTGADPTWSPDGTQIAYTGISANNVDIYIIDATGFNNTRLTTHPAQDYAPAWSPDGSLIAFKSFREDDTSTSLYVVQPNGLELRRLSDITSAHTPPVWSPNSELIAFTRQIDNMPAIHTIDLESGDSRRLSPSDTPDTSPQFTPDGESLIFVSVIAGQPEIFRMALDGSDRERLTSNVHWDWLPAIIP